jgi:hypothetical protein
VRASFSSGTMPTKRDLWQLEIPLSPVSRNLVAWDSCPRSQLALMFGCVNCTLGWATVTSLGRMKPSPGDAVRGTVGTARPFQRQRRDRPSRHRRHSTNTMLHVTS